ncbi:MAG: FAD-dependent oxidoreductase [Desulfobacteraceae bacterium]|jgi:protoporphyrinogen oxidase
MHRDPTVIIGAGPAGLAAAYELARRGQAPMIVEKRPHVGGMARTETHRGFRFDIGGHRFFTPFPRIQQLWQENLPDDFLPVERLSRIFYQDRFIRYPLELADVLRTVGLEEGTRILASYLRARTRPTREADTFEKWVSSRFGPRLYDRFFRSYTEKVWGVPCTELASRLAAERIQGLSLTSALWSALGGRKRLKTLTGRFHYPLQGPGMMWEAFSRRIQALGGSFHLNSELVCVRREGEVVRSVRLVKEGRTVEIPAGHLITSIPLRDLVSRLSPEPPTEVARAAGRLVYRDFILVGLIADRDDLFQDQWIYIHSPDVAVGRIQNFKNWSPAMVPDRTKTGLGLEYFCTRGDALWSMDDNTLIHRAAHELERLGLARRTDVVDGVVYRQTEAYPCYLLDSSQDLSTVLHYLSGFTNLKTIGRNGLHQYDNQDQAMLTGLRAGRDLAGA